MVTEQCRGGIAVGEEWELRLHERLHWASAVICLLTSAYVASPWCSAEVGAARTRGSQLLPVLAGPVQVVGTLRSEFLDELLADRERPRGVRQLSIRA